MKFTLPAKEWHSVLDAASGYHDEAILNLKEEGILIRVQDKSNTALYNTLIPKSVMSNYQRGEHPRIGFYIDKTLNITPKSESDVTMELDGRKIITEVGNRTYRTPNIDPEQVDSNPETVPNVTMPVSVTFNPDHLMDFIKDAADHVHSKTSGHFYIRAQEGLLTLWSRKDDFEIDDHFHWEDFEDYDIDWDGVTESKRMPGNPVEERRMTSILSIPLTKPMTFYSDLVKMEMGHGMPLKMVSESEEGIKHSWIIPPRFPTQGQPGQIPERIIKERSVV